MSTNVLGYFYSASLEGRSQYPLPHGSSCKTVAIAPTATSQSAGYAASGGEEFLVIRAPVDIWVSVGPSPVVAAPVAAGSIGVSRFVAAGEYYSCRVNTDDTFAVVKA